MIQLQKQYIQFSKRMATTITVFWCVYRVVNLVVAYLRPEIGTSLNSLLSGVDDVMMVSIGFYTGNSIIEKGITGYFGAKGAAAETEEKSSNG